MYETPYHSKDINNNTFLITGGAGFIGSNIVEYLLKHNAGKVRVLDNFSTGFHHNIESYKDHPSFELMEGDIRDLEVCKRAVQNIEYISHQAALGSVPRSINDPITTNDVNISGFLNMLVAAKDANVKNFVYAASSSTYGDHLALPKTEDIIGNPLSPYAVTKYVNELYAGVFSKVYNFHIIGLRYFNVFGPRQNPNGAYAAVIPLFIQAALKNQSPVINGDGETSRDFTFIENAVQANIKALFAENVKVNEIFNVAYGKRTTLNQLWFHICDILHISVSPNYREERKGDIKHSLANIDRAAKLLSYKPKISVWEGIDITINAYKETITG